MPTDPKNTPECTRARRGRCPGSISPVTRRDQPQTLSLVASDPMFPRQRRHPEAVNEHDRVNSHFPFHPFVPGSPGFDVRSMRRGKHLGVYPVEEQRDGRFVPPRVLVRLAQTRPPRRPADPGCSASAFFSWILEVQRRQFRRARNGSVGMNQPRDRSRSPIGSSIRPAPCRTKSLYCFSMGSGFPAP